MDKEVLRKISKLKNELLQKTKFKSEETSSIVMSHEARKVICAHHGSATLLSKFNSQVPSAIFGQRHINAPNAHTLTYIAEYKRESDVRELVYDRFYEKAKPFIRELRKIGVTFRVDCK